MPQLSETSVQQRVPRQLCVRLAMTACTAVMPSTRSFWRMPKLQVKCLSLHMLTRPKPNVSQVPSTHIQSFCDHMRRHTVMKDRHCALMAATWPHNKKRTPAEKAALAAASKNLHRWPVEAHHLNTAAICDAYVAGKCRGAYILLTAAMHALRLHGLTTSAARLWMHAVAWPHTDQQLESQCHIFVDATKHADTSGL